MRCEFGHELDVFDIQVSDNSRWCRICVMYMSPAVQYTPMCIAGHAFHDLYNQDKLPDDHWCETCQAIMLVVMGNAPHDPVNHPAHYTSHPSGIECIQITEHMNFCLGNAIKYIWRADIKSDGIEDLEKAIWYIQREIQRREIKC